MNLFGFEIRRSSDQEEKVKAFANPLNDDGAVNIESTAVGGAYGYFLDIEGTAKTESELVTRYRSMALQPEIQQAVSEIVNEAINVDYADKVVEIVLDDTELPEKVRKKISDEFDNVLRLLDFSNQGYDIFQRFYVDGRINYHIMIDENDLKAGIKELRYLDPRKIRMIRETDTAEKDPRTGLPLKKIKNEYFMYSEHGFGSAVSKPGGEVGSITGYRISKDSIARVTSGLMNETQSLVLSHLHSAIKPLNQLRILEDATVIYTLTRAPERRIFYVDVGNLPKAKAEQYLADMMARHKNKLNYNSTTGEIGDQSKFMTMTEDFWFPRREGCFDLSTKIDLLDGRSVELGQLIVEYKAGRTNWTYSVSPDGKIVPGKISWAGVTRNDAQVLDIHLDNGEVVTATPDHKFILRNGETIHAMDLQIGSSLMPFHSRKESDDVQFQQNDSGDWQYTQQMVDQYFDGTQPKITSKISDDENNAYESVWEELKSDRNITIEQQKDTDQKIQEETEQCDCVVTRIVWRGDKVDVGTLTIDENHDHHDYHNFALSAGIFVMNSRSTEIDTLPAGTSLSDNDNLSYFQRKLYKSLGVPISRLEPENMYSFGRVSEMTRDEMRFSKFIRRVRNRFSILFDILIEKQLVLKGILTPDEWLEIKDKIRYNFMKDNYFEELKQMEILREKMTTMRDLEDSVGKYFSRNWVQKNVLFMSDDDIEKMDKEIEAERKSGAYRDPAEYDMGGYEGYGEEEPPENEEEPTEEELLINSNKFEQFKETRRKFT